MQVIYKVKHLVQRLKQIKVIKLTHQVGDEMYGIRKGRNSFRSYLRFDLGLKSYRLVYDLDYYRESFDAIGNQLTPSQVAEVAKYIDALTVEGVADKSIPKILVSRNGQAVSERRDMWEKVWIKIQEVKNV